MKNTFQKKIRLIFIPFVYYAVAFVPGYTFLNWLLFNSHHVFLVKEEIRNFFVPIALPWIPLLIWYRPRIKLLKFKATARDPATGVTMLACFTIIAMIIIAQEYMSTASGKLTVLNSIQDIAQAKETRYYTISNYLIDRNYNSSHFKRAVSGKYSQYLDLSLYIVCPVYDSSRLPIQDDKHYPISDNAPLFFINGEFSDSIAFKKIHPENVLSVRVLKGAAALALYGNAGRNGAVIIQTKKPGEIIDEDLSKPLPDSVIVSPATSRDTESTKIGTIKDDDSNIPLAWVGIKYTKEISNRLSAAEKSRKIEEFNNASWSNYILLPEKGYTYFDEIPYNDDYIEFRKAVQSKPRYKDANGFRLLIAKDQPFEKRNGQKLPWIFGAFAIGSAIFLLILSLIPLDDAKTAAFLKGDFKKDNAVNLKGYLQILVPKQGFYATPIIIWVNIVIFIAMVYAGLGFLDFSAKDLLKWGGNYAPYISQGQWWRLFTSTFLHTGFMHLLLNMYGLLFVGLFLEPMLGRSRFAICYCATGIVASFVSYRIHPNLVGAGASGAIFGMYGIFLSFLFTRVFPLAAKKAFLMSTLIFVGYNLVMGLEGNVDNAAHIGGLISGFLIGLLLNKTVKMEREEREA